MKSIRIIFNERNERQAFAMKKFHLHLPSQFVDFFNFFSSLHQISNILTQKGKEQKGKKMRKTLFNGTHSWMPLLRAETRWYFECRTNFSLFHKKGKRREKNRARSQSQFLVTPNIFHIIWWRGNITSSFSPFFLDAMLCVFDRDIDNWTRCPIN